jgi:Holliday junction DNA helicase RuvA
VISSIRGEVLSIGLDHAVVEVGGVGLAVRAVPATLATLRCGEQARLTTALVVREDSLTLYGFADPEARGLFGLLQTVSGFGPRLALATLAVLDPATLRGALAEGDLAVLTSVPGVGRKGAERLVVELRDKVGGIAPRAATEPAGGGGAAHIQVVEALVGLGFAARQAEQAVEAVLGEGSDGSSADTSAVLRSALTRLGRNR